MGTEWGRESIHENVWISHLIEEASHLENSPSVKGVVVSDVRFRNELGAIHEANGTVLRIVRPATAAAASSTGVASHASEAEQTSFQPGDLDAVVTNDRTLEDMLLQASNKLRELGVLP